jgi:octopine/nopaline transport system permease protein
LSFDELIVLIGFGPKGWGLPLLLAALTTLAVSAGGFLLGAVLGGIAAWGRLSNSAIARRLSDGYCTLFRGVPDLLTIYFLYFGGSVALTSIGHGLGMTGFIGLPAFATGVIALGIISGAYQAEVYRGAYLAIPRGLIEAGHALAMPDGLLFRRIVIPLLLRYALPGLGNVWQLALKDSALISVTGLVELMRQSQIGAGSTRQPFVFYVSAAVLYFVIAGATSQILAWLERRSLRGVRRA